MSARAERFKTGLIHSGIAGAVSARADSNDDNLLTASGSGWAESLGISINAENPDEPKKEPENPENAENPDEPKKESENPNNPDNPDDPKKEPGEQDNPDNPDESQKEPENPDNPDDPKKEPENPDNPDDPKKEPENPDNPESPDEPKKEPENPDNPDDPKKEPENPDNPDNPEEPKKEPDNPDKPTKEPDNPGSVSDNTLPEPDSVSENSISENSLEEYGIALLMDDGEYGTLTDSGVHGANGDNLLWKYYDDTKTLVICPNPDSASPGGDMKAVYSSKGQHEWKSYYTRVEKVVVEEGVTALSQRAFMYLTALEEVWLPESLKVIGQSAFDTDGAGSPLKKINPVEGGAPVNIPSGVEEIRTWAFAGCTSLGKAGEGDNYGVVRLPDSLSKMGYGVFFNDAEITSIQFDDGITGLQLDNTNDNYGIFQGCTNLREFHLPAGLTSLTINGGTGAWNKFFAGCTSLTELTIPGGIGTVPKGLRLDTLPNLEVLTLGQGINVVEGNAYSSNKSPFPTSLVELNLPRSLETIPNKMCMDLGNLQRINPIAGGSQVNFPEGLTDIGNQAFAGCNLLGTAGEGEDQGRVCFPASLSTIGQYAFYRNPAISSLVMSDAATAQESLKIGQYAFCQNTSLESVHFGDGKKALDMATGSLTGTSGMAFADCTKLVNLHFPKNLESLVMANNAWKGCSALEELYLPGTLKTVTREMNLSQFTGVRKLTFGQGMEEVERASIYDYKSILPTSVEELYLPEGFRIIPVAMCNGFANLKKINPGEDGSQINFPKGLEEIGERAFSSCKNLGVESVGGQTAASFPKSLTWIGQYAFSGNDQLTKLEFDSPMSGELKIDANVFDGCSGLSGELRLPDGLVSLGQNTLYGTEYRTELWTTTEPFLTKIQYRGSRNEITFESIRFRGVDDRDEIEVDGAAVSWSSFYDVFIKEQNYNRNAPKKLHVEDTVKRLASDTFWKDFKEVTFHGENVVTLDHKGIFNAASASLKNLEGTYYVSPEGALYLLDENTKQAALAYCPPGVTALTIPASIHVTDNLTGVYDKKYNGTYSVTSVLPHAIIEAKNLTTITAAQPERITLGMRAFADCPTLTQVNGVTTQKEANALFGPEGTSARKYAFVNTGLLPDENPEMKGQPRSVLKYVDGAGSMLEIKAYFVDGEKFPAPYEDDAYRLMTGEKVRFDINVNTNADTKFKIYFQPSDSDFEGFIKGDATGNAENKITGKSTPITLTTGYDAVAGSYYCEFRIPAGATMYKEGIAGSEGMPALYPAKVDARGDALNLSKGGELCVWAELVQDTPTPSETPGTGENDYMMFHWGTKRTDYQVNVRAGKDVPARLDTGTKKPTFKPLNGDAFQLGSQGFQLKTDLNSYNDYFYTDGAQDPDSKRWRGRDPVEQVCWQYQVVLPEGMEWKSAEEIAARWGRVYNRIVLEAEVSEDKRTLVCRYTEERSDTGNPLGRDFSITPSQWTASFDGDMVIREDYDFFTDSQITYDCSAVVYYRFSEPKELVWKSVTDTLKGLEPGEVTFARSIGLDEEHRFGADMRGKRGCTVLNTLWAYNASAAPAPTGLVEVTDTLVDGDNGYLYLTAEQLAAILLDGADGSGAEEESGIRVKEIRITDALLYGEDAPFSSGVTHIGIDGQTQIMENLLNHYTAPKQTGAVLSISAERDENLRLQSVALTINENTSVSIPLPADLADKETLAGSIAAAMEGAGYRFAVASGRYQITWQATPEAKAHTVDVLDRWEIGSYEATVKLDCQQAHHYIGEDSPGSYHFYGFPSYSWGYSRWLAEAVFTYEGRNEEGDSVQKTQKSHSPRNRYQDDVPEFVGYENISAPDNSVLAAATSTCRAGQTSWADNRSSKYIGGVDYRGNAIPLHGGDFIRWRDSYTNKNNVTRTELVYEQSLIGQALLVPCDKNPGLSSAGYEIVEDPVGDRYFAIVADGSQKTIDGVWLGYRESASGSWYAFYAETVELGAGGDDASPFLKIRWYDRAVDERAAKEYRFLAQVRNPVMAGGVPEIKSVLYENGYLAEEGDDTYSARLVVEKEGVYRADEIKKDILKNPETLDDAPQNQELDTRRTNVYISAGGSVTYRLSFDEYWDASYTLPEGAVCDRLPDTAECFDWEVGKNVHVRYLLHNRDGAAADGYREYVPDTADFCKVTNGNGKGQYLYWGDFTIPVNHTLYIYVTLDFPDNTAENGNLWDGYVKAVDRLPEVNGVLTNAFRQRGGKTNLQFWEDKSEEITESIITHKLAKPPRAYLKTGKLVYQSDLDKTQAIFTNSDQKERTFSYYVVLYNDGESNLYLNPVHLIVPKGFTLDIPNYNYASYYNCMSGDEAMAVRDGQLPPGVARTNQVYVDYRALEGETGDNGEDREVVLEFNPRGFGSGLYGGGFDADIGKSYLEPGRFYAAKLTFTVGAFQETDEEVMLPAAMPVDNSLNGGTIEKVDDTVVSASLSKYPDAPAGTPLFFETDEEVMEKWGFEAPEDTTGKWVASEFTAIRAEAGPGLIKGMPVLQKEGEGEYPYKPQEGTAMEHPVKWETELVNNGANALNDFHIKDSIQWPYVFDGEVALSDNWQKESDKKSTNFKWQSFTITRYTEEVTLTQDDQTVRKVEKIDRDRLMVNNVPVEIAPDRNTAMADPERYSVRIYSYNNFYARVWFYKENAFGSGAESDGERAAETMELDFGQRYYGTSPGVVDRNVVTETKRTLSYWTRFDLSKMMENVGNTFINRALLLPGDSHSYHREDVCEGIPLNEGGNAIEGDEEKVAAILASSHVTISVGQSTQGWIMAEENLQEGGGLSVPEDVAELLSKNQTVLLSDRENTVTYTMGVLNQAVVVEGAPQNAEERKYSLQDMVLINSLPHVGDKTFFQSDGVRGSEYQMRFASDEPDFDVKAYYYDDGKKTLQEVDAAYYRVLYSDKDSTGIDQKDGEDWKLQVDETGKDVPYTPPGWYTKADFAAQFGGLEKARSVRIEFVDSNDTFTEGGDNTHYRELMKPGRTIVVKYQAKVEGAVQPGEYAWNAFGYRFKRFVDTRGEAFSSRTGVRIPTVPTFTEMLVDEERNPYPNPGPEGLEFTFTIRKKAGKDENHMPYQEQTISFTLTLETDESEKERTITREEITQTVSGIVYTRQDDDTDSKGKLREFWQDGALYEVVQTKRAKYYPLDSISINGVPYEEGTGEFRYYSGAAPEIVYTNIHRQWNLTVKKVAEADNEPLKDALFGLYTEDAQERMDETALAGNPYYQTYKHVAVSEIMLDENTTLYLKDLQMTDKDGLILWEELEGEQYYVRELVPPRGCKLNTTCYCVQPTTEMPFVIINEPAPRLADTGGIGTIPFYILGVILVAVNTIIMGRRGERRRRKKDGNKSAGPAKTAGVALTAALAVKVLVRVVQIRRERRKRRG